MFIYFVYGKYPCSLISLNNSFQAKLTNENSETFNFGVLNGVRGFFTNPSRADDCFVPFTKGKSGTFISASTQYGTVFVECGFNPKVVYVILPFSNGDTLAICFRGTKIVSKWMIPQENKTYDIAIGSSSGETGIVNLTDNGFVFRSNSGNTLGVECSFYAGK